MTPTPGAASELLFQELLDAERRILNLLPMVAVDGSTSGAARHEVREIFSELRKLRTPAPVTEGAQREAVANALRDARRALRTLDGAKVNIALRSCGNVLRSWGEPTQ